MQKKSILLLLVVLIALPALAQEYGSVSGIVSTEGGEPVGGADVVMFDVERNVIDTRTDRDGTFAFERVPVGAWHVTASRDRIGMAEDDLEVAVNQNTEIDLVLHGGEDDRGFGSVNGTVSTEEGDRVGGAEVVLFDSLNVLQTQTDDEGAFAFERVPVGAYIISATQDSVERGIAIERIEVAEGENIEVNLVFREEGDDGVGSISGIVFTEDREPAAQATVLIDGGRGGFWTLTDGEGAFVFGEVPAGWHAISASLGDLAAEDRVEVVADENSEIFLMLADSSGGGDDEFGSVSGTVTTNDGEPIDHVAIYLWDEGGERPVGIRRDHSDDEGAFTLREVPFGVFHITAELEGVGVAEDDVEVVAGENTVIDLVLGEGEIGPEYGVEEDDANIPVNAVLLRSYPNPFNSLATIDYTTPIAGYVNLSVYDVAGRHIQTLSDGWQTAGKYQAAFKALTHPAGMYILRLEVGEQIQSEKMLLLK